MERISEEKAKRNSLKEQEELKRKMFSVMFPEKTRAANLMMVEEILRELAADAPRSEAMKSGRLYPGLAKARAARLAKKGN